MGTLTGYEKECTKVNISAKKRATPVNLHIEEGATFNTTFTYKIDGTPVDLTGTKIRTQFRKTIGSPDVLLELSLENGYLGLEPTEGKIIFKILPEQTRDLNVIEGVWDLEIEFSPDNIIRLMKGSFFVDKEVTR